MKLTSKYFEPKYKLDIRSAVSCEPSCFFGENKWDYYHIDTDVLLSNGKPLQRDHVWDIRQKRSLIISILKGFDIVPSTLDLSGAEIELSSEAGREFILKELIDEVRTKYDFVIIDSPPSLGLLTINAFTAADEIIIPLQAQFLAMQGLAKLVEVVDKIKSRLNKGLKIGGVFITQYDSRKVLNRDVNETINEHFKSEVFKTKVRDNIALAEAPAQGLDIFRYNAKSNGAEDYLALAKEIAKRK